MTDTSRPYTLIIGLGRSGLSMARYLRSQGQTVKATDINPERKTVEAELNGLGIETQIGFHDPAVFENAACLVPSPGIPLTIPHIANAVKKGVPVSGELDIFYQANRLPVIAITGTNGKTTTTTLLGELLASCGFTPFVGGNIGIPLVELLMDDKKYDVVVAEISSFQMDLAQRFRPEVGVLLNIAEDHLDRYDSFADYKASKWRLFEYQKETDTAVINQSAQGLGQMKDTLSARLFCFSSGRDPKRGLDPVCRARISPDYIEISHQAHSSMIRTAGLARLSGLHNQENLAAALLAGLAVNADIHQMETGLKHFKGLSHRIEPCGRVNGVRFYNDSKATNVDAVIRALESLAPETQTADAEKKIVLILGGRGKGTDFSQLSQAVEARVKAVVALGETRNNIIEALGSQVPCMAAADMAEAVQKSVENAVPGDRILLSPACASFDMYDNYARRGDDFKQKVNGLEPV